LSYLRVKLPITKVIEDNTFYILLLFNFQKEKKIVNLKVLSIFFETILFRQVDILSYPQKKMFSIVFAMGDFTLRLIKYIEKWFCESRFVYVARGPERENKQCSDILLKIWIS